MSLNGKWIYSEDFKFGINKGIAQLYQTDKNITGTMIYTEIIEKEPPFTIKCHLKGLVSNNNIEIKILDCEIIDGDRNIEFVLGKLNGSINSKGDIVGSTIDNDGVCGVFTLERKA